MNHRIFGLLMCCTLLLGVCLVGCNNNGGRKAAGGVVTLDGKPVEKAHVTFIPQTAGMKEAMGTTDAQGNFTLRTLGGENPNGIVPGEYKVIIFKTVSVDTGKKAPSTVMAGEMDPVYEEKEMLPGVYKDPEKTPLSATVGPDGLKSIEFKLESKK